LLGSIHSVAENKLVQVSVWNRDPASVPIPYQYTNVLYTSGYYNCYTLQVNLNRLVRHPTTVVCGRKQLRRLTAKCPDLSSPIIQCCAFLTTLSPLQRM
jgi:hypothetical protein